MTLGGCPEGGWVRSLKGRTACITGKVLIDGEWIERKHVVPLLIAHGGSYKPDYSRRVDLIIYGNLASAVVTDPQRHYSQKLDLAQADRERGYHPHVVDARGFTELLNGGAAACRALTPKGTKVLPAYLVGDGVLGGPLTHRLPGSHGISALAVDLSHLDAGTAAHEATAQGLRAHLALHGMEARGPARGAPLFDLGWVSNGVTHIAEVKSLTGASEDQQIRLGFGQLLDYCHQLRSVGSELQPVLVLQHRPASERWLGLAESEGIVLTWGPEFPGVPG